MPEKVYVVILSHWGLLDDVQVHRKAETAKKALAEYTEVGAEDFINWKNGELTDQDMEAKYPDECLDHIMDCNFKECEILEV